MQNQTLEPSLKHITVESLAEEAYQLMDKYESSDNPKERKDLLHMIHGILYRQVIIFAGSECDPSYIPEAESSRLRFLSLTAVPRFKEDEKICSIYIY